MHYRIKVIAVPCLLILITGLSACAPSDDPASSDSSDISSSPATATARSFGLIRISVDGIGTPNPTASAANLGYPGASTSSQSSGHTSHSAAHSKALTAEPCYLQVNPNPIYGGDFTFNGERYLAFTFQVRNAQGPTSYTSGSTSCTANTAYPSTLSNITLIGINESSDIAGTPFATLNLFNGSAAPASQATSILPTHGMVFNAATNTVDAALGEESLQVYSEAQIGNIPIDPDDQTGTYLLPYGYVVHNVNPALGRTLQSNPASGEYDGEFTFAVKLPVSNGSTSIYSFQFDADAVIDSVTSVTESEDEQNPLGDIAANLRALNLMGDTNTGNTAINTANAATGVIALGGGHVTATNDKGNPVCTVRIAGPASSPTAYLVQNTTANVAAAPDNMSGLLPTGSINAGFCQPMTTPNGIYSQFVVSGSQSGAKPNTSYGNFAGGGTNVISYTPAAAHPFFPGEQVNYTLTSNLVSVNSVNPMPFTGSFTVGGLLASMGQFVPVSTTLTGNNPDGVVVHDFNGDGIPDLATADEYGRTVTVLLGNGDGTYHPAPGSPITTTDAYPDQLVEGDFNDDGIADLAVVNEDANNNSNHGTVAILIGNGAGGFTQPNASISVGLEPSAIAVGDFEGDGKAVDLAVLNIGDYTDDGTLSILINKRDGSGTFNTPTTITTGVGVCPRKVAIGDFNGDGKMDLAFDNAGTNCEGSNGNVSILLRTGAGTFTPATNSPFAVGAAPRVIAVSDYNGDGKPDLAVANYGNQAGTSISILLNKADGSGNFNSASSITVGTGPYGIAAGDFNGDGKPDLAVANQYSGNVSILLGSGGGGFSAASDSPITLGGGPSAIASADLNDDGRPDLVTTNYGGNNVDVLLGDGNGIFYTPIPPAFSPVTVTSTAAFATVAADFNGDGLLDFAVTNYTSSGTVSIFLAQASGGYVAASGSPYSVGGNPSGIVAGDFNNDGHPDLAVANSTSATVSILTNSSSSPGSFTLTSSPSAGTNPTSITSADFNGDGYPDLAVTNNISSPTVTILSNNKSGGFKAASGSSVSVGGTDPFGIVAGDFNGDGHPDLAVTGGSGNTVGTVSILTNNGSGGFTVTSSPSIGGYNPYAVTAADFNGDGSLDLAVAEECTTPNSCNPGAVAILSNNGSGVFALTASPAVGSVPQAITVADFNGDGHPDLAVTNLGSNNVSILLGSAQGTFTSAANSPVYVGTEPFGITAGDFFGTHKLGLAVANYSDGTVTVLPQK